ncbi:MAG: radical SAM protein, partial [Thermoplasmata archaeon]|nr:radical SAM protein [Thermoplasmata archaeon]
MRWNNLSSEAEERARLPGYRDDVVVRHFEAPDAISTRFYEVRAKSILNRVPEASRMPFRWTINPYRGCTHACSYCLGGDTRILGVDGREIALRDLEVGARIYGTSASGTYRRFVETEVLAKWSSLKPAFRVELEDGTELIASEEHRFLTRRGFKHVTGAASGRSQRPHLTPGIRLMGPGGSVPAPRHNTDYRRGYLCGVLRGDGPLGRFGHARRGGGAGGDYRFRLAMGDEEALTRAREFLAMLEVATTEFRFVEASGAGRPIRTIRAQSRSALEQISSVVDWPPLPSLDWARGFLAGIFDAEGSCSHGALRIYNHDEEILARTVGCMRRLGFDAVVERRE